MAAPTRRQGRLVRAAAEVARGRGPLAHGILGPVAILVPPRVTAANGGGTDDEGGYGTDEGGEGGGYEEI